MAKSLQSVFPKRVDVPILIAVSIGLLIAGWFTPTLKMSKFIFGSDEYSIWQSVATMWSAGDYILSIIILLFSMIFPVAKLSLLGGLWFAPAQKDTRDNVLKWLSVLGKWSMLDVFVVAVMVVLVKARSFIDAEPMYGIYIFTAAIGLSMIVSFMVDSLAKKA